MLLNQIRFAVTAKPADPIMRLFEFSEGDFNHAKRRSKARCRKAKKAQVLVRKVLATDILSAVDEVALWQGLLWSENQKIRLEALKYLTDRRDGKAPQSVTLNSGPAPQEPVIMTFDFTRNKNLSSGQE